MTDQTLPTFDPDLPIQETPAPRKPRPRPQRKRPAKKAVKRVAPPKPAKRVPKKRRTRKPIQYGTAVQKAAAGHAFATQQIIDEMKMDFVAFLETVCGFTLEPWQARIIKALAQEQK